MEKPPVSTHFSENQRIRLSTSVVVPAAPPPPPLVAPVPFAPLTAPTVMNQDLLLQLAIGNPALAQLIFAQQAQQFCLPAPGPQLVFIPPQSAMVPDNPLPPPPAVSGTAPSSPPKQV